MQLTPLIAVHLTAALAATAIGPVALWARKAGAQRPQLHRAAGYAWVTLMLLTATSAIFIQDYRLPNFGGFTPIHLLIPVVYGMLFCPFGFWPKAILPATAKPCSACTWEPASWQAPSRYCPTAISATWFSASD